MKKLEGFPWRTAAFTGVTGYLAAFGSSPWREFAVGMLTAEVVVYAWVLNAHRGVEAFVGEHVEQLAALAAKLKRTDDDIDVFTDRIAAICADAVAVVGQYDHDEAAKLALRVGASYQAMRFRGQSERGEGEA